MKHSRIKHQWLQEWPNKDRTEDIAPDGVLCDMYETDDAHDMHHVYDAVDVEGTEHISPNTHTRFWEALLMQQVNFGDRR